MDKKTLKGLSATILVIVVVVYGAIWIKKDVKQRGQIADAKQQTYAAKRCLDHGGVQKTRRAYQGRFVVYFCKDHTVEW